MRIVTLQASADAAAGAASGEVRIASDPCGVEESHAATRPSSDAADALETDSAVEDWLHGVQSEDISALGDAMCLAVQEWLHGDAEVASGDIRPATSEPCSEPHALVPCVASGSDLGNSDNAATWDADAVIARSFPPESPTSWSKGSALHAEGACKPCGFLWTVRGCVKAQNCHCCHLHDKDWRKARRKEKARAGVRTARQLRVQCSPSAADVAEAPPGLWHVATSCPLTSLPLQPNHARTTRQECSPFAANVAVAAPGLAQTPRLPKSPTLQQGNSRTKRKCGKSVAAVAVAPTGLSRSASWETLRLLGLCA